MDETCELTIWVPSFVVTHEVMFIQNVVYRIESSIGMLVRIRRPRLPGLEPCPSHPFATLFLFSQKNIERWNGGNIHGGRLVEERDQGPSCCEQFVFYPSDR